MTLRVPLKRALLTGFATVFILFFVSAQNSNLSLKYTNSVVYAGIEVGSKGVKMSLLEIGKNVQKNGNFNILKDTSVNTRDDRK